MFYFKYGSRFAGAASGFLRGVLLLAAIFLIPTTASADAFNEYFKAVKLDNADKVKELLQRGIDPNMIEEERYDTGLILALREESMKVFQLLLNTPNVDLEAKSRNGDTALMIAAYKNNKAAVEALLARNVQVNRPGWTALHYAAAAGADAIIRMLFEKSAYIDAESPNKTTPIMMAAWEGHIWTVKLLLDEGADATLKNERGMTAIDFARAGGHEDIVEGLTYRLQKIGKPVQIRP